MKLKKEGKGGGREKRKEGREGGEKVAVVPEEEEGTDWGGKQTGPNLGLELWSYSSERYPYARY